MRSPGVRHTARPAAAPCAPAHRAPRGPPPPAAARRNKATDESLALAAERIAALERENAKLRAELSALGGVGGSAVDKVVLGAGTDASAAEPVVAAAPAAISPPPPPPSTSTVAPTDDLAAGIVWPTPGEPFWERPARKDEVVLQASTCTTHAPPATPLSIVHIAAELAPRVKVGGLGDVVAGLSLACAARGHAVTVMLPWYECLNEAWVEDLTLVDEYDVPKGRYEGDRMVTTPLRTRVWSGTLDGVDVLLVRPDWGACSLFRGDRIYGGAYNEAEAYLYFCRACLDFLYRAVRDGRRPPPTALHIHDWQACAAGMLYWHAYATGPLAGARVVLTVHNFDSAGEVRMDEFGACGVDGREFARVDRALDERTIGHNPERLCLLKGGLVYSNQVVTVSPTYATEAAAGGAAGFLRSTLARPDVAAKFGGVLNGIDVALWNPASDPHLPAPYHVGAMAGKALNKRYIQTGLGLDVDPAAPLVICVTRLVPQKGIHLIKRAMYQVLARGGQFVLLGTGHADGEFRALANGELAGSKSCKLLLMYSEPLAHALFGAGDIVLVPSLFEPCGLTQLCGLRYGTVPLVRRTGGLADTVFADGPRANGFVFDGADEASVAACVDGALDVWWTDGERFEGLRRAGMQGDVSWDGSAGEYVAAYGGE